MFPVFLKPNQNLDISDEEYNKLHEKYYKLIYKFVGKFTRRFDIKKVGIDVCDLIQLSNILLVVAHKNYDESKGFRFTTLFCRYLINAFNKIAITKDIETISFSDISDYYNIPDINKKKECISKVINDVFIVANQLLMEGNLSNDDLNILEMTRQGCTYLEIGKIYNVTAQRIHQRLEKIHDKIRRKFKIRTIHESLP